MAHWRCRRSLPSDSGTTSCEPRAGKFRYAGTWPSTGSRRRGSPRCLGAWAPFSCWIPTIRTSSSSTACRPAEPSAQCGSTPTASACWTPWGSGGGTTAWAWRWRGRSPSSMCDGRNGRFASASWPIGSRRKCAATSPAASSPPLARCAQPAGHSNASRLALFPRRRPPEFSGSPPTRSPARLGLGWCSRTICGTTTSQPPSTR